MMMTRTSLCESKCLYCCCSTLTLCSKRHCLSLSLIQYLRGSCLSQCQLMSYLYLCLMKNCLYQCLRKNCLWQCLRASCLY
ncbi:hypothetical protein BDZ85DRAFT_260600 [Elsinoe ampelina]|uniref:Uncharacterized protein n=1 Tax=Elsinoe ampelina TaxID=302913 RepID=A0A6A6GEV2_9PEZI|nr:hypothetical protein BDZ85DRAFT_260600 [Elsinoe ampelina]